MIGLCNVITGKGHRCQRSAMKVDWWGLHLGIVIGELRCCWVSLESYHNQRGIQVRGKRGMKESEPQKE